MLAGEAAFSAPHTYSRCRYRLVLRGHGGIILAAMARSLTGQVAVGIEAAAKSGLIGDNRRRRRHMREHGEMRRRDPCSNSPGSMGETDADAAGMPEEYFANLAAS